MNEKIKNYLQLMRFDKPVGTLLLLWPTLWSLWIAAHGWPNNKVLVIFVLGVIVMRAAGCVINDFADRRFDAHVARTNHRPIATNRISPQQALILFVALAVIAFALVSMTNTLTISISFFAIGTAILYPFMKRFSHCPQCILGIAFSFSVPMAFAAQTGHIAPITWALMLTTILWTIAYDTQYAMVDRADDLKIGIKSTAILFGRYDRFLIGLLQLTTLGLLFGIGLLMELSRWFYAGLFAAAMLATYQQILISERDQKNCFRAFLNNQWFGFVIFVGIFLSF